MPTLLVVASTADTLSTRSAPRSLRGRTRQNVDRGLLSEWLLNAAQRGSGGGLPSYCARCGSGIPELVERMMRKYPVNIDGALIGEPREHLTNSCSSKCPRTHICPLDLAGPIPFSSG